MLDRDTDFPPVERLPECGQLPDPLMRLDGSAVGSPEEWPAQREYLKSLLSHYMYGSTPPRPGPSDIEVVRDFEKSLPDIDGVEAHYRVGISRNGLECSFRMWLIRPSSDGPYPTVIKNCRSSFNPGPGEDPTAARDREAAGEAVSRGYMLCKFRRGDLADDTSDPEARHRGIYPLYPEHDWGSIAAWAWGQSVVADGLNGLGRAGPGRLVATGHSRGGQTAMAAGIMDERFGIVAPCTGGFGSCGTLRVRDPQGSRGRIDYIAEVIRKNNPHWFCQRYIEFAGRQERLPFDGHTLVALIAPRPLLSTGAIADEFNNALSIEAGLRAGRIVYEYLGRGVPVRVHWREGTHAQRAEDWRALLDFADEMFFGRRGTSLYNQWRYPERSRPALRPPG